MTPSQNGLGALNRRYKRVLFGFEDINRAFGCHDFFGFPPGNPCPLTPASQEGVGHNPLARQDPEKLVGHYPGKVGIPLITEVDGRHRNAHNGNHDQVPEEPKRIRQKQVVAVGDQEIGDDQSGGNQDGVNPKAPEVIGPERFIKVG